MKIIIYVYHIKLVSKLEDSVTEFNETAVGCFVVLFMLGFVFKFLRTFLRRISPIWKMSELEERENEWSL